jgi:hypothetical protein
MYIDEVFGKINSFNLGQRVRVEIFRGPSFYFLECEIKKAEGSRWIYTLPKNGEPPRPVHSSLIEYFFDIYPISPQ